LPRSARSPLSDAARQTGGGGWAAAGGKISFDKEANAEIYGEGATAQKILSAPASTHNPPEALRPLCAPPPSPLQAGRISPV